MDIANFDDLLRAARQQAEPQRLLFVFARAKLPADATPAQRERFAAGEGGELEPVMCADKSPEELTHFTDLVAEAAQFDQPWQLVFVSSLSGRSGMAPSSAEAQEPLQRIVDSIKSGAPAYCIPFNAAGDAVQLG